MARSVRTAARTLIQSSDGYQRDLGLNPVQNRVRVSGSVNVTSYTTGGEVFTGPDIGLTQIDEISVTAAFINNTTFPTATHPLYAAWTGSKVILTQDATNSGGEANSGQAALFWYEALGPSQEGGPAL